VDCGTAWQFWRTILAFLPVCAALSGNNCYFAGRRVLLSGSLNSVDFTAEAFSFMPGSTLQEYSQYTAKRAKQAGF